MRCISRFGLAVGLWALGSVAGPIHADVVQLTPERDNTMYGESPEFSNGMGWYVFAGKTNSFHTRRALLFFDVAAAVPSGATIESVNLTLRCSKTPNVGILDDHEFGLHRVLADWGEGSSDAPFAEGFGVEATAGDATWEARFFDPLTPVPWATPGGDFAPGAGASQFVGGIGFYDWETTSALVADVQGWLDAPATNFGWILIGEELDVQTARRFDSRNHATVANHPVLTVEYTPGASSSAGAVPDGDDVPGLPMRLSKGPAGEIVLGWRPSCLPGDDDYEVYSGTVGAFYGHQILSCTTAGATTYTTPSTLGPAAYFLVVPTDGLVEGSYGRDSQDVERPGALSSCGPQNIGAPICPITPRGF